MRIEEHSSNPAGRDSPNLFLYQLSYWYKSRFDHGQLDMRSAIDALLGGFVVGGAGSHDVRDERLRIPVVERDPTTLDLHHDPMSFKENMVGAVQAVAVLEGRVGRDGLGMLVACAIAATKDLIGNHQLVARH